MITCSQCDGIILADTEDWTDQFCYEHYSQLSDMDRSRYYEQEVVFKNQIIEKLRVCVEFYAGPDCGMQGNSIIKDGILARKTLKELDGRTK